MHLLENTEKRVCCGLRGQANAIGSGVGVVSLCVCVVWFLSSMGFWPIPMLISILGFAISTLQRTFVFDKDEGLLYSEEKVFGLGFTKKIPLFHLKAVFVEPRFTSRGGVVFVSRIEKRTGEDLFLDESKSPARLVKMAKAIADLSEIRFVYETSAESANFK